MLKLLQEVVVGMGGRGRGLENRWLGQKEGGLVGWVGETEVWNTEGWDE